jgi:hypothetical protein
MELASRRCHWSRTLALCCLTTAATGCTDKQAPAETRTLQSVSQPAPVGQGRRIALVVGNSGYASAPLINPANDAALIATTLTELGFQVQLQKESDQKAMKRAIQDFGAALEQGGADTVGLFYYAGHGVQLGGRNYLIPVGANIARDADVELEAVSADWVLEQMRYARNRLNFVILDACRNNPFARSFRSAGTGLAKMDAPAGVLIAYSTAPGDVAADGVGRNSPYTEALSRAMRESGEPAELMFKQTRDAVRRVTAEQQTPWESSSLTGQNFYFASMGRAAVSTTPQAAPQSAPQPVSLPVPAPQSAAQTPAAPLPAAAVAVEEPYFMADALCRVAVGRWRLDADSLHGFVTLDGRAAGIASVKEKPQAGTLSWDCDGRRGELVVQYGGAVTHKLRAAGDEKLMFGYDQDGKPVVYTR